MTTMICFHVVRAHRLLRPLLLALVPALHPYHLFEIRLKISAGGVARWMTSNTILSFSSRNVSTSHPDPSLPCLTLPTVALRIPTTTKRKPVLTSSSLSASSSNSSLTPRPRPPVSKARSHPLLGGEPREEEPSLSASVSTGSSTPVTPLTPTTPPPSAYRVRSNTNASLHSSKTPTNATYTIGVSPLESSSVIIKPSPASESSHGSCQLPYLRL